MKKQDDYISGPHHYWIHFVCGFVLGAGIGYSSAGWLADSQVVTWAAAVAGGLVVGYWAGQSGERCWARVSEVLRRWGGGV